MGGVLLTLKMDMWEGINLPGEVNIVSCKECGNCYADTSAGDIDYDEYYSNHNYYGAGWSYNSSSETDRKIMSRIIKRVIRDHSPLVMDIGCGNGKLLDFLKAQGIENLVGVDPSMESIADIKSRGYDGYIGSVYNPPVDQTKKADIIVLSMVLEHLLNPGKAIENLKNNYLNDSGYLVVSWPRFEDMIADDTPIYNNFNHEHINYFSMQTADRLFRRYGFIQIESHVSMGNDVGNIKTFSNVVLYKCVGEQTIGLEPVDENTSRSILDYANRVAIRDEVMKSKIKELSDQNEKVVVWGTGAYLMHLMSVSELRNCKVQFIVDNNLLKQNKKIYGFDVREPEHIKNFDGTIIVTAMLYGKMIERQVRELGNSRCRVIYYF